MAENYKMFIDGGWVSAHDGATYDDMNPYTGEVFAHVAAGRREDARRAIAASAAAFPGWAATPPGQRQALFLKAADILEQKRPEIVRIIAEETGGTFGWALFQSGFTPGLLRQAAAQVHQPTGEIIPADTPDARFMTIRQPVGVVAGIAPWNAPLILSLRSICLPMAYGNTVVLKPSSESAVVGGVILAQVFEEAGFPAGVMNLVTNGPGAGGEIGDEFIENAQVRRISFTGSTQVGREIAEKAGRQLKRVALELGGNNPLLVLRDADVDYAVNVAAWGAFLHQGQICMSVRRIIVEEPIVAEFTRKLVQKTQALKVGNPAEPDTVIGPIINRRQLAQIQANVERAVRDGATVLCGGRAEGPFYHPTVLANVDPAMDMCCEETFGPVVSVLTAPDLEAAIHLANATQYGLSAGVVTEDLNKALWAAERIESGMVHINDSSVGDEPQVPFGGIKESGIGRMGGRAAIEEFTELRWISYQQAHRQYPW